MQQGWKMMPWYGMIFGPIMMITVLATVVTIVVLIVRWIGGAPLGASVPNYRPPGKTPIDILEERFAKGEIDKEEFEERRRVLSP